jgi:hypothetical protein
MNPLLAAQRELEAKARNYTAAFEAVQECGSFEQLDALQSAASDLQAAAVEYAVAQVTARRAA